MQVCTSLALGGMAAIPGTCSVASIAAARGSLVQNGDFDHWTEESPRGWQIEVGAKIRAGVPVFKVKRTAGPSGRD